MASTKPIAPAIVARVEHHLRSSQLTVDEIATLVDVSETTVRKINRRAGKIRPMDWKRYEGEDW